MRAKRDAIRQRERTLQVIPNGPDPCANDTDKGYTIETVLNVYTFGESLREYLDWEENTSCSQLKIGPVGIAGQGYAATYWERVRYGSLDRGEGCPFIGYNEWVDNFQLWEQVNWTFEFWVNNSAGCGFGSSHSFVDIALS